MLRLASLILFLAIGALGCVEVPDAGLELGTAEQAVIECDDWQCGSNSSKIDSIGFHELNIHGLPNAQGFQVITLWKNGLNYQLSVEQGRIIGRAGSLSLQGQQLVGAQLRLRRGLKTYAIRINAVATIPTFAKLGGAPRALETYQLDVNELVGDLPTADWRNLCVNIPMRDSPDLLGMNNVHALVFEGERINAAAKTIGAALDPAWFNIGCAGHALAKLAINAQTEAARVAYGFNTSILERQAFLKMLTADYCGTGTSFTVPGQPLRWRDWRGYTQYEMDPMMLELEARWTSTGATCLNTPRVNANPTQLGWNVFLGNVVGQIQATCGNLPPCAFGVNFFDAKLVLSANPL